MVAIYDLHKTIYEDVIRSVQFMKFGLVYSGWRLYEFLSEYV